MSDTFDKFLNERVLKSSHELAKLNPSRLADFAAEIAIKSDMFETENSKLKSRIAELEAALKVGVNLALNVRGSWDAFEPLLRREIGNTNYHCVEEKSVEFLSAARAALEHKE